MTINALMLAFSRFLLTYIHENLYNKYDSGKNIAIVGYNETAEKLADYFGQKKKEYNFHGFFDDEITKYKTSNLSLSLVGPIEQCIKYAQDNKLQEIYSTILPKQNKKIQSLIETAERNFIRLKFVPDITSQLSPTFYTNQVGQFPVITLRKEPLEQNKNRIKKRIMDIIISSLVIVFILSWLTPILTILIKLSSKGPVFFLQKRSGKKNESFSCIKFRSMRVNQESDKTQAKKDDNRVTWIGSFMRKTSVDELPQFFNVFKGDMSIIGPRPHMLSHTEQYSSSIDKYMVRHFLKPGISGWAQVNGYRGETETNDLMRKRVEYDLWYIENWSLMLDIRILFLTIIQFFKPSERAY